MDKVYQPHQIEQKWYQAWEQAGCFDPANEKEKNNYCIMIPPPNVTGTLHMGHAFQDTIMDTLIRYHRMVGDNTLWQMGTDHAGIATQMVVERQLAQQNKHRRELGREAFVKKIWDWKAISHETIAGQLRTMGASVDWQNERFTMDEGLSKAVVKVFVDLYREGLIYRGKRLVNWDPVLHTALSDLEVISEEEQGSLWHIRYPIENSDESIVIATTRPETLLGDAAVAVHPEDTRYQHLVGKKVKLPLCDRCIPIIADDYVDPEFGTGCVKITPAHDFNDYEVGKRHDLPLLNILTFDAKINTEAPKLYQGMDRFEAREQIIKDLETQGLLESVKAHTLKVPRGDRSHAVLEPMLTDQWFVKVESLAKPAIEAVESGAVKFVPENWQKVYFEWMHNIQDWCISRQLWWGHRIPAWYDDAGNVYVGEDEEAVRQQHQLAAEVKLFQDEDVLDTWFSSALWPFSTLGWPEQTERLQQFYPTSVLVTGFDIIFFWVARMMMFGLKFTGKVPFHEVYIHGLIQDKDGQKMSKSKGNILDPLDLINGVELESLVAKRTKGLMQPQMAKQIEKQTRKEFPEGINAFGTDALRFTFCALATTGRFIRFDLAKIEANRNFCNKLWNAARYVLMNVEGHASDLAVGAKAHNDINHWIVSLWQHTKQEVQKQFKQYRFDLAAQALYEFIWNEYCDWYLELSKPILFDDNTSEALLRGTRLTLVSILEEVLSVLHPIMPFITEEIWQRVAPITQQVNQHTAKLLIQHRYPHVENAAINPAAEEEIHWLKQMIVCVRTIRGELNVPLGKQIKVILALDDTVEKTETTSVVGKAEIQKRVLRHELLLQKLAKIEKIDWLAEGETAPQQAATGLVDNLQLYVPIAGIIDTEAETKRIQKELDKIAKDLKQVQSKLDNPNYLQKAPAAVVDKEKNREADLLRNQAKLQERLQAMAS